MQGVRMHVWVQESSYKDSSMRDFRLGSPSWLVTLNSHKLVGHKECSASVCLVGLQQR